MTSTIHPRSAPRTPMTALRKTALVAGGCYLVTFIASFPTLGLYSSVRKVDFIVGSASATPVQWGAFLEVILALSSIGTAIALFPVVKRQNESAALGFVTSRVLEAALIVVGVISLLSVVTVRKDLSGTSGANTASLVATGRSLVAVHDWTFLLGQGVMPGVSALLLGSLMYRSRLVPRIIPLIGLIGAPLLLASDTATIFGIWAQVSAPAFVCALPVAVWEFSLGVWMVVKGFRPSAITAHGVAPVAADTHLVPA